MSCAHHRSRRERARELRLAGLSLAQIREEMGIRGSGTLTRMLRGIPAPEWTRRPKAKDDLRARAVEMRLEGKSYREISEALGVSRASCSLWLRDVPLTDEQRAALAARFPSGHGKGGAVIRSPSIERAETLKRRSCGEIGLLGDSALFIGGTLLYWAEGSKAKPWNRNIQVSFINSDPGLITVFLRWLRLLGVSTDRLTYRVSIHETADVRAATEYWARLVGADPDTFRKPTIKRHNPKTVRHKRGEGYRGCLIIRVRSSTDLYWQVEGWYEGIVSSIGPWCKWASTEVFEASGEGSNPSGPAHQPGTVFESSPAYQRRASA